MIPIDNGEWCEMTNGQNGEVENAEWYEMSNAEWRIYFLQNHTEMVRNVGNGGYKKRGKLKS